MKIGIITFHASFNYGSMLQAYALHKVLSNLGHYVEIINFRSVPQREMYRHPIILSSSEWSKWHMIMHYVKHFRQYYPLIQKWNKYNAFLKKYLVHTKEFKTVEELRKYNFQYDYLVVGSDQIWNTRCFDFNEAYLGNFCNEKVKVIAYAPSMGENPESQEINIFKNGLNYFHAISVREERTRSFLLDKKLHSTVSLALDPTLLLDLTAYDMLENRKSLIKGDYIFFYDPYIRPQYLKLALHLGQKLGYTIVVDRKYPEQYLDNNSNVFYYTNVGPKEFLNLIKYAKIVLGHSLHAVIFSILYKKDFFALNGDKDSRMSYLLKALGLYDRVVNVDSKTIVSSIQIDYWDIVYEKYSQLKETSLSFLTNALSK